MGFLDRPEKMRWPRNQRFVLSVQGIEVEKSYREIIVASRVETGRASFDVARETWAGQFRLQADDGLYLAEILEKPLTMAELVSALESCGKTRTDAMAAMGRLFDAGYISSAPAR